MTKSLAELDLDAFDVAYYSEQFRAVLEQNLDFIKAQSNAGNVPGQVATLTDAETVAYEGDFRKVARRLNIPFGLVWITMRLNDILHYEDYHRGIKEIRLVSPETIQRLFLSYTTSQKNI